MGFGRFFNRQTPKTSPRPHTRRSLSFDSLEDRLVMTVSLGTLAPPPVLVGKHTYVPLVANDTEGLPVSYSVSSANTNINASIITAGRTLVLNVSGTDSSGNAFTGNLVLKLFEDKAPETTARIIQLVNSGFYNGLTFHRVVKGFVIQGGDPNGDGTGGSGTTLNDEFDRTLTFNSLGMLAMANSGDDNSDSQFFITDTTAATAAQQNLNFNYTIFGQIVDGLDVLQKILNTPVTSETPNATVTINSASVINTNKYAILDLSSLNSFTGSGTVTVTVKNAKNQTGTQTANVTVQADAINGTATNDLPFLPKIIDRQVAINGVTTFDVVATDLDNDPLTFVVRRADFTELDATDNVTVSIQQVNNVTARITITPKTDFAGLVNLKIGVTQVTSNAQTSDYDTQAFNMLYTANPLSPSDLKLLSGTGIGADNTVTIDTPTIQVKAAAGQTVKILLGGTEVGTATETSTPGTYTYTFPVNKLLLGTNVITAVANDGTNDSLASATLNVNFAPSMQQIYVVPGAAGEQVTLTFNFQRATADIKSELGLFVVDDLSGKFNGIAPGASTYWSAVSTSANRSVIFSTLPGGNHTSTTFTFAAGTKLAFYLSVNKTLPKAVISGNIFSSIKAANKDGIYHTQGATDHTGLLEAYGFEDTYKGGDRDYNDMVFTIRKNTSTPTTGALAADIANPTTSVKTKFAMLPTLNSRYRPIGGEIGIFEVLDAQGTIAAPISSDPNRTLKPGDAGYAQAALSQLSKQVLFTKGDVPAETTRTITMAGGSFFGVYYIPRGTASGLLSTNASNTITAGQPVAYFSFAAANPDGGKEHMRSYGRDGESRMQTGLLPISNDPVRVNMMGTANGNTNAFSDLILQYSQSV
ncbi:MAG TPA: peptidylprolyl isomerase [Gemmatales bacterium]|nr:peptidylprolyl isomerase [Gemmatales bacterium]